MKYFFDTEFMESPGFLQLLSIGIKAEDGRELYLINKDAKLQNSNQWVKDNVFPYLPLKHNWQEYTDPWDHNHPEYVWVHSPHIIRERVLDFVGQDKPEWWAHFADYDWVVLCWLFGPMVNLPKGWPFFCRDLRQFSQHIQEALVAQVGFSEDRAREVTRLPGSQVDEHHALADARWNARYFEHLNYLWRLVLEGPAILATL